MEKVNTVELSIKTDAKDHIMISSYAGIFGLSIWKQLGYMQAIMTKEEMLKLSELLKEAATK